MHRPDRYHHWLGFDYLYLGPGTPAGRKATPRSRVDKVAQKHDRRYSKAKRLGFAGGGYRAGADALAGLEMVGVGVLDMEAAGVLGGGLLLGQAMVRGLTLGLVPMPWD